MTTDPWLVERAISCLMEQGVRHVEVSGEDEQLLVRFTVPGNWGSQEALEARMEPFALDPSADP